jgi:glucose/arabinose dehydrogenase
MRRYLSRMVLALGVIVAASAPAPTPLLAQATGPTILHPQLDVRPAVEGLNLPTSIAFLDSDELLVLEKNSGKVLHVEDGVVQEEVLDLSVNFNSERGLLGIALHPSFPTNPGVYLFWSCRSATPLDADLFTPEERECSDDPAFMTGLPDSGNVFEVPLLGNRVDRFEWTGSSLEFDDNLIKLLAFQNDAAPVPEGQGDSMQPPRANHDGGVIAFGRDGKLYVMFGDVGRRGQLQNLPTGPGPGDDDDQFGGPEPDDAHFTGVILRLNPDGSTPADNPFFEFGASMGGDVGENLQRIFAYGIRNSFGMAFDPLSGRLWDQENGEDAFDEINLVEPGMNSGWIQIIGPADRLADYKGIETTALHHDDFPNLQQFRWGPERIADSPAEAMSRLFALPGSRYSDPEFSWKHVVPPAAIGFVGSRALGPQFEGDLFVGSALPTNHPGGAGFLFRFNLTGNRRSIAVDDPRLEDRVADNLDFHGLTESEDLLIGEDFGVVTDIETGPNGNLFVVSLDRGAIYEIFRS